MIVVRSATLQDASVIADFNIAMALETEAKTLDQVRIHEGVRTMAANPDLGFYLVACKADLIVGCLGVTYEWSDWRCGLFWWIQSVYVHPDHRNQGAFSEMFTTTFQQAKQSGNVVGIRLYAEKDNERAISTYHRLGMATTDYRLLEIPLLADEDPIDGP